MPKTTRSRTSVKRERPDWWNPEGVLDRLQSGSYIVQVCGQAAADMAGAGVEISVSRLRADVAAWCESATWGDRLREALALWKRTSSGEMALQKHWHEDFFAAMEVTGGNAEQAAQQAGIGYGIVLAVLDRRNKCHDAEFAERFRIAELERVGRIRTRYLEVAEAGEGKAALRAQERVIETALPMLHGQKQINELHVSGRVEHGHEHVHVHGLSAEIAREVIAASQARVQRLGAGRGAGGNGLLPADTRGDRERGGRVIDVTPVAQRAGTGG